MPDFANLRKALLHQSEPDRVPLFEGSIHEDIKSEFLGRPVKDLESEAAFWMKAGYDYAPLTVGLRQIIRGELDGLMGVTDVETTVLKPAEARYNPFREETSVRMWAEEGEGIITDEKAFDAFPWPKAEAFNYTALDQITSYLPPGAKAIVNVGYIFMATWMLMGLETFCTALADNPDLVGKVFERVGTIQEEVVRIVLDYDCVGALRMPDDMAYTTGLIVSPDAMRRHVFPWHKRIGDLVHKKGLPYLLHSDGQLYEVLDDLIDCGYDGIHPIEPAAMDIAYLKREYGDRLSLCGNIDLGYTLTRGKPEEVEEEVKIRLREIAPGGGYGVGSSNSIPEYVPYENYMAMRESVLRYGRYPIQL